MKFEKRADGGEVTPASSETPETGKKPVIIYILILFLAAFLLMFLSMLSHQRSNTEALGQLQNSVSAIQEIQATQEQIIELQKRLDETEAERDEAKEELKVISDSISDLEKTSQALMALYNLQQEYLTGNLDGCLLTLQEISRPASRRASAQHQYGRRYASGPAVSGIKRSDLKQVNIIITIISIKSIKENELCSTLSLSGKIPTL